MGIYISAEREMEMTELINEKISLLYDFCILTMRGHKHDPYERRTREMLNACQTENEISRVMHDILVGNYTLEQTLIRKGFLKKGK